VFLTFGCQLSIRFLDMPQKGRKDRKKPSKKASAPAKNERKKTSNDNRARNGNVVQQIEFAKNLAYIQARLPIDSKIRTQEKSYNVVREVDKGVFSYLYEVKQKGGNNFYMITEPITNNKDMERFKLLKFELLILRDAMKSERSSTMHFPRFQDSGCTDDFKFIIMQGLGETLYDITRKQMKSAFSMSTALRVGIQMLRSIMDLHTLGFLHRSLRPHVFFIGTGTKIRTVYMGDFGLPFMFRDPKTNKIRKPRKHVRMMGALRYMSRNAQMNQEHARRDDLESWAYMTMEFVDLEILPWNKDQVSSDVLYKKQKTVEGSFPMIFTTLTLRFKAILRYIASMKFNERPDYLHLQGVLQEIRAEKNVDFNIPYDWEVFSKNHDDFGVDPVSLKVPPRPQLKSPAPDVPAEPAKEYSREDEDPSSPVPLSTSSVEPAEINSLTISTFGDGMVEVGTTQVVLDKVIEVDMASNCINKAERSLGRSKTGEKERNDKNSPKFELSKEM